MKTYAMILLMFILMSTTTVLNAQTATPSPTLTPGPVHIVEIAAPESATMTDLDAARDIIESRLRQASITLQDITITEANTIQVEYVGDETIGYELVSRAGYLEVIDMTLFTLSLRAQYLGVPVLTRARRDNPLYINMTLPSADAGIDQPLGNPFFRGQPFHTRITGEAIAPGETLYSDGIFGIRIVGRDDDARSLLINVTRLARGGLLGIVLDGTLIAIPYIQGATDYIEVWNLEWDNERDIEIVRILLETGPLPFTPQIVRSE